MIVGWSSATTNENALIASNIRRTFHSISKATGIRAD